MARSDFEATARRHADTRVIDMRGEVNRASEAPLNAAYEDATRDGPSAILLNFFDVDYINSTGIAVIVGILARARKEGKSVSACGLSEHYREIFEITRLSDFMTIFEDEEQAVTDVPA
jgi:anti-anti-sigma factor